MTDDLTPMDASPQPEILTDLGDGSTTPLQHKNPTQEPAPDAQKPVLSASDSIKAAMAKMEADSGEGRDGDDEPVKADKAQVQEKPRARSDEETYKASRRELGRLEKELATLTGKASPDELGDESGDGETVSARIAEVRAELAKLQSEGKDVKPPAHLLPSELQMWTKTPRSIQAAVDRITQRYESQIAEHQEAAAFREGLREYEGMAKAANTSIKDALDRYVGLDKMLAQDFGRGMAQIAQSHGRNPVEAVAQFMRAAGVMPQQLGAYLQGQPTPQQAQGQPKDATMQRIEQLERLIQDLDKRDADREQKTALDAHKRQIEETVIAPAMAEMPRFNELSPDIVKILKSDIIDPSLSPDVRLREAYHVADRIKPALRAPIDPEADLDDNPPVQISAGKKSISGAPGKTSTSSGKPKILSIRDSLALAMRNA